MSELLIPRGMSSVYLCKLDKWSTVNPTDVLPSEQGYYKTGGKGCSYSKWNQKKKINLLVFLAYQEISGKKLWQGILLLYVRITVRTACRILRSFRGNFPVMDDTTMSKITEPGDKFIVQLWPIVFLMLHLLRTFSFQVSQHPQLGLCLPLCFFLFLFLFIY